LLLSLPGCSLRSLGRENPGFGSGDGASCIGARTILKWDYNLEIHDVENTQRQAGSDGSGR
jgi:hypothetical protein